MPSTGLYSENPLRTDACCHAGADSVPSIVITVSTRGTCTVETLSNTATRRSSMRGNVGNAVRPQRGHAANGWPSAASGAASVTGCITRSARRRFVTSFGHDAHAPRVPVDDPRRVVGGRAGGVLVDLRLGS